MIHIQYTFVAGFLFRLDLGKESYIVSLIQRSLVTFLLELEDITLLYYSSDQELNINELWSLGYMRNNLTNIVLASSNSVFCLLGMLIRT